MTEPLSNGPRSRAHSIDFEDDMPSGIAHLPPESQAWAMGLHRAVKEIRDDARSLKKTIKLLPIVTGAIVAIVSTAVGAVTWIIQHVR